MRTLNQEEVRMVAGGYLTPDDELGCSNQFIICSTGDPSGVPGLFLAVDADSGEVIEVQSDGSSFMDVLTGALRTFSYWITGPDNAPIPAMRNASGTVRG